MKLRKRTKQLSLARCLKCRAVHFKPHRCKYCGGTEFTTIQRRPWESDAATPREDRQ